MMNNINYSALLNKGFCVIKNLLTANDLKTIRKDFKLIQKEKYLNPNANIFPVGKKLDISYILSASIEPLALSIQNATNIQTNHTCTPLFFSTKLGINFGFHQDHESWFLYGDHINYLNIWIPIIKPKKTFGNLSIVNFEKLFNNNPHLKFLKNYGATQFIGEEYTTITDDNSDKKITLNFHISHYAETPHLSAGDAIVMRGDCIHRTQDITTNRLAISIRRLNTNSIVHKDHYKISSPYKKNLMHNNPHFYEKILKIFSNKDTCLIEELL